MEDWITDDTSLDLASLDAGTDDDVVTRIATMLKIYRRDTAWIQAGQAVQAVADELMEMNLDWKGSRNNPLRFALLVGSTRAVTFAYETNQKDELYALKLAPAPQSAENREHPPRAVRSNLNLLERNARGRGRSKFWTLKHGPCSWPTPRRIIRLLDLCLKRLTRLSHESGATSPTVGPSS